MPAGHPPPTCCSSSASGKASHLLAVFSCNPSLLKPAYCQCTHLDQSSARRDRPGPELSHSGTQDPSSPTANCQAVVQEAKHRGSCEGIILLRDLSWEGSLTEQKLSLKHLGVLWPWRRASPQTATGDRCPKGTTPAAGTPVREPQVAPGHTATSWDAEGALDCVWRHAGCFEKNIILKVRCPLKQVILQELSLH